MNWISIKDKLPRDYQKVMAFNNEEAWNEYGPFFICNYSGGEVWYVVNDTYPNCSNYYKFVPTHWMPLPETPKD